MNIIIRIKNALLLAYWGFMNPVTCRQSNFKMLSDLLTMILKTSSDNRPYMTHIAYVHPEEGEKQIVSIWAGAGLDSCPTKRIAELVAENHKLKENLSKMISNK